MKVLVTGGGGFIGSHLVETLIAEGQEVTILDDFSTGKRTNLRCDWPLVVGDIRDPSSLADCLPGTEAVFHLAAFTSVPESLEDPETCYDINVNGTRTLLEESVKAGVSRFVFASTSAIYPDDSDAPISGITPPRPESPYAQTKLEGEQLLERFHRIHGINYTALRFFNVYGPRQDSDSDYASVIPIFVSACQRNLDLTIHGNGLQTRDFIHVSDVARVCTKALNGPACGKYNVGTSRAVSILCVAKSVIRLTGSSSKYKFDAARPGDSLASTADISLTASELGWTPRVDFEAGLKDTIQWFRSQEGSSLP